MYRFFKNLDYVDPAKAAIWGWVNILYNNYILLLSILLNKHCLV